MKNSASNPLHELGGCLFAIAIVVLITSLVGWAFASLWNWVVPDFWPGAPHLTVWKAVGVLMLIGFLQRGVSVTVKQKKS